MAQVFLSYAREDRECAEILARALTNLGWSVWWDRLIDVGGRFSKVIERELAQAKCVIVLWSHHSVQSDWVQSEASDANQREILVPVRIEEVRLPLEFSRLQTGNLCDWRKGLDSPEFKACLASVEKLVRKKTLPDVPFPQPEPEPEPAPVDHALDDLWILQDGQRFCAPDPETLRKWAKEGRVRADSKVYDPAVADWVPAREFPVLRGVYPAPAPLPRPAPQPQATGIRWPVIAAVTGVIGILTILLVAALIQMASAPARDDMAASDTQAFTPTTEPVAKTTDTVAMPTTPQPISVSLQNRCMNRSIVVAVCYLNNSNQWVSRGWWSIPPGQTSPNAVAAYGSFVYFYAVSVADGMRWEGRVSDAFKPVMAPISLDPVNPFVLPADQLKGNGVMPVSFAGAQMDTSQPTYLYAFFCN
jgi:hypothetical protein